MPVHTRNLLLFAALSLAAVLTSIFARGPRAPEVIVSDGQTATRGYVLRDAVLDVTGDEGGLSYRVIADRVEQQPDTEDFVFEGMQVEYDADSDVRWRLAATAGYMPGDRSYFLLDDASLLYVSGAGDDVVTIETSELRLDASELMASTEQRVVFRQGRSETSATGMSVNLETDTFELKSDVTTQFLR